MLQHNKCNDMMSRPLLLALIGLLITGIRCTTNVCTDQCDSTFTTGAPYTICGTDLLTHTTHYDALSSTTSCYKDTCQVMTYYVGPCGCPNNCFAKWGQGECSLDGVCECSAGWTGKDCSLVGYGNKCSLHGKLISTGDADSEFPFDYCDCDDGFTGIDCSSAVFSQGFVPFGNIFDGKPYTNEDKYGDDHPVWNTSLVATLRIELDDADFLYLLQPWNSLNETYVSATAHFDNKYTRKTLTNVGFKQKGSGCKKHQKHCWNVKLDEFVDGQDLKGYKKLGIKGGTDDDDVLAKYMMYVDMMRASVIPTQRTTYVLLYINNVFFGLNLMHEDIDDDFMTTRIDSDDGKGNLMKFDGGVYLQYLGEDVEVYQNNTNYEQVEGDGDWTDFVDLLYFFNSTSDADFKDKIENRVDVDGLLRIMIVESFLMDTDGMTRNGRNYNLYHLRDKDYDKKWALFSYDFDMFLEFNIDSRQPYMGEMYLNIFTFFQREFGTTQYNPLFNRLLAIPKYNETFVEMYRNFLDNTFGSKSKKQPTVLHGERLQFVLPWMEKDLLWQLSNGIDATGFMRYGEYTIELLTARFFNITSQLDQAEIEQAN